jgi:hypothetical protein
LLHGLLLRRRLLAWHDHRRQLLPAGCLLLLGWLLARRKLLHGRLPARLLTLL